MMNLQNLKTSEGKVIIPLGFEELQMLMCDCVRTTIESYNKEQKQKSEQKYVSAVEAAKMFGCNPSTINRWKHSGYLTPHPIGGKDYYSVQEIDDLKLKSC